MNHELRCALGMLSLTFSDMSQSIIGKHSTAKINKLNKKGTMTDEEKVKLVSEVMQGFDFEKTRKMMMPSKAKVSINELKVIARNLLFMCLEHQDREFWWAGGMHRGGLCACYDDKWGLSLNYIAVANKVRIPKD